MEGRFVQQESAMHLRELNRALKDLVSVEPTGSPVISCYVNLEDGPEGFRDGLAGRIRTVRRSLPRRERRDFEEVLGRVEDFLGARLDPAAKGAAVFARGGESPLFVALQFRVPLPTWFAVQSTPSVYHLVELKDTYHRYVVVILTAQDARIVEVNLGAVTEELWGERPAEPEQVRERWTREHYRHWRAQQTEQFLREKVKVADRLMAQGGHSHLVVAGDPRMVDRFVAALPRHLASKLVDVLPADPSASPSDVILETLSAYVRFEERESREMVDVLLRELEGDGLADAGTADVLRALRWGQADALVLARSYRADPGWTCRGCGAVSVGEAPKACGECGDPRVAAEDLREAMVRLAERNGSHIEVVNESPALERLGGVGCLLRYRVL